MDNKEVQLMPVLEERRDGYPSATDSAAQKMPEKRVPDNPTLRQVYDQIADHNRALFEQKLYEWQGQERLSEKPMTPDQWILATATELGINLSLPNPHQMPTSLWSREGPYVNVQSDAGLTAEEREYLKNLGYQGGEALITSVTTSSGEDARVYLIFHKKGDDKRPLEITQLQVLTRMYGAFRELWNSLVGAFDSVIRSRARLSNGIAELRDRIIGHERKLSESKTAMEQGLADLDAANDQITNLVHTLSQLEALATQQPRRKSKDSKGGSQPKRHRPCKLEQEAFKARAGITAIKDSLRETRERINAVLNPKRRSTAVGVIVGGFVGGTL